ncbi:MAG: zf-HC2 domain-containing protein, partial [Armatimonadetes bacterium]|nr:zf-HC2 domain-containing protein [Armatimonadota bacterium]
MNNEQCDKEKLEAYLRGELDDAACTEVEAHALKCGPCRAAIEARTKRVADALKETYPLVNPPAAVADRVMALTRPRRRWRAWALALAPAAAALFLVWAFWPEPSFFTASDVSGIVIAGGERVRPGQTLKSGTHIVCLGDSSVTINGVRIINNRPMTEFTITERRTGWRATLDTGEALFVSDGSAGPYDVFVSGKTLVPKGTRFGVHVSPDGQPELSVYESEVLASWDGIERLFATGQRTDFKGKTRGIAGDPMTVTALEEVPAPFAAEKLPVKRQAGNRIELPADAVNMIASELVSANDHPNDPMPYLRAALIFNGMVERELAATTIGRALDRDPDLRGAEDDDLWKLVRGQALNRGDEQTADKLLDLLERRGGYTPEYLQAWRTIAESWGILYQFPQGPDQETYWNSLRSAVTVVQSLGLPRNRAAVGETLVYLANYGPEGYDAPTYADAAELLREAITNPSEGIADQETASTCKALSEALWYTTRRDESLEWLETAVDLWPIPRWQVHLAERSIANGHHNRERLFGLLREGLTRDPSVYTYRKALNVLVDLARSPEDWEAVKQTAHWVAGTFSNVPIALISAGRILALSGEIEAGSAYMAQAAGLVGGPANLEPQEQRWWATILWKLGERDRALEVLGAEPDMPHPEGAWRMFGDAGDYATALKA